MSERETNILPPDQEVHNLTNYQREKETFRWENVIANLPFNENGKLNAAFETVVRSC